MSVGLYIVPGIGPFNCKIVYLLPTLYPLVVYSGAYETSGRKFQTWGDGVGSLLSCNLYYLTYLMGENYKLQYLGNPWIDLDNPYYVFEHRRPV